MSLRPILIADGDPYNRDIGATILRHAGYRVLEAADGETLLQMAVRYLPAAIVTELRLPGSDGFAALATLRGRPRTASIPVVVVTTCSDPVDLERARRLGCEAYVTKPYRARTLLSEVQWALSRPQRFLTAPPLPSSQYAAHRAPVQFLEGGREAAEDSAGSDHRSLVFA